jgi:hypothetical protein
MEGLKICSAYFEIMLLTRIWQYILAIIGYWQFWIGVAFMVERSFERYFPRFATSLNLRFPQERRRPLFVAIAIIAFVYANFRAFDDLGTQLEEAKRANSTEDRWSALTNSQATALRASLRELRPESLTVACETIKCRDLADGIADVFAGLPGWKVTKLHRGGFDITGVVGIKLFPNEPETQRLQAVIEKATNLKVDLGDETRAQMGSAEVYMTVGSRPF